MTPTTLTTRALIRLSGEDVRGFLQGLVTNDVAGPLPAWAALLTPQGKCLFDFFVRADGDDLLLDCERDVAGALAKRLTMYRLRRAITIEPEDQLAVHWRAPAQAGAHHETAGVGPLPAPGHAMDPRLSALGHRWLAPASDDPADDAYRTHRLSLGVTEGVAELGDATTLWLECNAAELNGVSFTKGCYVGQENTARMNWRAKVNRRLVVVPLAEADARRQIVACPDLGLSVEHRRVEDIPAPAWRGWMGERASE